SFLEFMDHEGWRDMERQFLLPNRAENLKASVDEHREIIEALKAGEAGHAVDLAHEHYRRALEGENHG
ncbi:MAG: FCD domain-containing protein, partial [Candidatus Bipolaricaulis sp.]|nr:FCD domain-containing protein [Candidatus Bipolaricaulis sp.]